MRHLNNVSLIIGIFATKLCLGAVSDLPAYLNKALESSYRVLLLKDAYEVRKMEQKSAGSSYLPEITVGLELSAEKEPRNDMRPYYGPAAGLNYDLYSVSRARKVSLAKKFTSVAKKEIELSKNDQLYEILNIILDFYQSMELQKIAIENRDSLRTNLNVVRRKNQAGDLSKVDVSRAQARLLASDGQFLRFKQSLITLKNQFYALTNVRLDTELNVKSILDFKFEIKEKEKMFFAKSAAIQRADFQIDLANLELEQTKALKFPVLSLSARHNHEYVFDNKFDISYDTRAVIKLDFPLYTGGRLSAERQAMRARLRRQKREFQRVKSQLNAEADNLRIAIEQESLALQKFSEAAKVAKKVLNGRKYEFENGGGRNNLVLDAVQEYLDFKRAETVSQFSVAKNYLRMAWRSGELDTSLFAGSSR